MTIRISVSFSVLIKTMDGFTTPIKSKASASIIASALKAPPLDDTVDQSPPISVSLPWEKSLGQEKLALVTPHVLSEEECNTTIQSCEAEGFEQAMLNVGGGSQMFVTDVQKSRRCIVDNELAVKYLWERLKHAIPEFLTPGSRKVGPSVFGPVMK